MKKFGSRTLLDKIWDAHIVTQLAPGIDLIYIDTHFIHEVTSPQAFAELTRQKRSVRRADRTFATCDHNVSTTDQTTFTDELSKIQVETLVKNCKKFGIELFGLTSPHQGIVHVIGPELGITQPGNTIVCGDSHTSTHGAFGALAFGIGTTEVEQVLATQCLIQKKPNSMQIVIEGNKGKAVTAKDIILTVLAKIGTKGGVGYCFEYCGEAVTRMSMEERMTVCNMSIEGGARAGMIAVDDTTISYLKDKPYVASGNKWNDAVSYWKSFVSDPHANYDKSINIDLTTLTPLITYGTDPATGISIDTPIPDPSTTSDEVTRQSLEKSLKYMNLKTGIKLAGFPIDYVFIGSCTNARLSDLQDAANLIKGKKVKKGITAWVVPGSRTVKREAEKIGLDRVFTDAGFEWRWSGCSACIAMNGDLIPPGKYCVSTSNRNYEGRQGPGARTFLASPLTAAASALAGRITDPREYV